MHENPLDQLETQDEPLVDDRLDSLMAELPDAPGVEPAAPAETPPEYVTRAQYDALQSQYASLAPIAAEMQRDPALAERVRRGLILGDVAAPGSRAHQQPVYQQPQQVPQVTPEILDRLRAAMLENPAAFTDAIATAKANQIVNERMAPLLAQGAQTQAELFTNRKAVAAPDEYAMVAPYFHNALQGVDLAQLAPQALSGFLEITYRAARGDAYAAANEPGAHQPQVAAPGLAVVPNRQAAPPYGGASGAVGSAQTRPLVQRARASTQPRMPAEVIALANKSGLTKQDFEKYGADVVDQLA